MFKMTNGGTDLKGLLVQNMHYITMYTCAYKLYICSVFCMASWDSITLILLPNVILMPHFENYSPDFESWLASLSASYLAAVLKKTL